MTATGDIAADVVAGQLFVRAQARRFAREIDTVFQRFNHDELAPLHRRLVAMGCDAGDAAKLLGAALRMAGDGIASIDG